MFFPPPVFRLFLYHHRQTLLQTKQLLTFTLPRLYRHQNFTISMSTSTSSSTQPKATATATSTSTSTVTPSTADLDSIPPLTLLYKLGRLQPSETPSSKSAAEPNAELNDRISLIRGDITRQKVDAIVNAANS